MTMKFDILTIFPDMFVSPFEESIIKNAREAGLIQVHVHNLREFTRDKHRVTDDYSYGGGPGMVMKPEPIARGIEAVQESGGSSRVILLTPQGRSFDHQVARRLSSFEQLILICGRYEGVDERIRQYFVDEEISIGDFVLTGGELAAMVVVDAVARLIPGVLGAEEATDEESFSDQLLEYPQYTRPREFRGLRVPEILLSGDHGKIQKWRRGESLRRTWQRRPDLLDKSSLSREDLEFLERLKDGYENHHPSFEGPGSVIERSTF